MASRVEQAEIKTIRPLSSTLELFDAFKSQEEDKDSDEESFHLPMLSCDDDNDMENCKGDILTSMPNGETEDDILNRFETNTPENIDVKEEHLLVHEDNGTDKTKSGVKNDQRKKDSGDNDLFKDMNIIDETDESFEETKQLEKNIENSASDTNKCENRDQISESKSETLQSGKIDLNLDEDEKTETTGEGILKINDLDASNENIKSPDINKENISKSVEVVNTDTKENSEYKEESLEHKSNESKKNDISSKDEENESEKNGTNAQFDIDNTKDDEVEFMELDVQDAPKIDLSDTIENACENTGSIETQESKNETDEIVTNFVTSTKCTNMDMDVDIDKNVNNKSDTKKCQIEFADELEEKMETDVVQEKQEPNETKEKEKIESDSKEIQTNKDDDCEDLLDISVILDADEDNASALSNDKSEDVDEQDDKQDNDLDEDTLISSDKDENTDFDEGNTNSCDQYTSTIDMGVSEHTSDGENKDSETIQSESDSQNPPSVDDITEMNSDHSFTDIDNKSDDHMTEKPSETRSENGEVETLDDTKKTVESSTLLPTGKRPLIENDNDSLQATNKKMKMSEEFEEANQTLNLEKKQSTLEKKSEEEHTKANSTTNDKIKTLITFKKFMKQRNLGEGKLTRSDLEQFCLQKICEALIHKTETGELHHTIKKQEQIIESLRKDVQQLTKQTKDLDIVNKKLMSELRSQNISQKPIVPLKITRSVGLQVKLCTNGEQGTRRKSLPTGATPPRTPTPVSPSVVNRQRNIQANNNVVRQVTSTTSTAPSPRKTPTAPILTQALQIRPTPTTKVSTPSQVNKRSPLIRTKPAEQQKPNAPGVIDLTDEDDKTAKNVTQKTVLKSVASPLKIVNGIPQNKASPKTNSLKGQSKSVTVGSVKTTPTGTKVGLQSRTVTTIPQGVRLTPAQMKNGIAIPASVVTSTSSGATQLMYVVQSGSTGSSGTGVQKAVLLNFQPTTNGVLTSALNGSTVSMIPSKSSNIQLKTLPTVTRKHPAPLPLPPPAVVNASLKPLLPKPHLSIRKTEHGIILQWRMPYNLDIYEGIASYQLFAYQETNAPPSTDMWRKVGDVKALALPMACTLTQFADKNKYYFAVRSVDVHKRIGAFSDPEEISL